MSRAPDALRASYAACRRMARRSGSSFYPSFLLLDGPRRRAMEAVYAFLRYTDDLADGPAPIPGRREALARWRFAVAESLPGGLSFVEAAGARRSASGAADSGVDGQPDALLLLPALADACRRFRVPVEHLFAVLDGVEMDLQQRRYRTFDALMEYCDRVASAVGLVCIHLWGFRGEDALRPARCCGRAFQLTNILRDLREDADRGRVYLPLEDFDQCGYSPGDLLRGVADDRFDRLMALQIGRARELFREGVLLFDWLERPGRRMFGMMASTYGRLLETIARRPRSVLQRRVRLPLGMRLAIAARWTLLPAQRPRVP
mgnify:CR=1 FL=1